MLEFQAPKVSTVHPSKDLKPRRRVVIVTVPGGDPFDLIGPMAVLQDANWQLEHAGRPEFGYDIEVVSNQPGEIFRADGLRMEVDKSCHDVTGPVDTIVFQAVDHHGSCLEDRRFIDWVADIAPQSRRMVTACIGTYVLAEAGLLKGRRATTHWMACEHFRTRYGEVTLEPEPIYVQDGKFYSSAGVTAILDLMLALVEEDFGSELALRVAQSMVLFLRRPASQAQFSVQLRHSKAGQKSIERVLAYIADNPEGDLSVEALADVARMSPRNFTRIFTTETGQTPGKFVEMSRVEAARSHLEQSKLPVSEIARLCGYRTPDGMRAAFDRNLGVGPREYRRRFATSEVARA